MPDKLTSELKDSLVHLLEKNNFKKHLIRELNENIDIPIINEKTEKKILDKIYETILVAIKKLED
tara:strand:- start:74 stop:268 length:195 start_codon:yes stop_codon:yes gene_type:complete